MKSNRKLVGREKEYKYIEKLKMNDWMNEKS